MTDLPAEIDGIPLADGNMASVGYVRKIMQLIEDHKEFCGCNYEGWEPLSDTAVITLSGDPMPDYQVDAWVKLGYGAVRGFA